MLPQLEDCYLDHVAIAVKDITQSVDIFTKLGLEFSDNREVVEEQKVITAFAHIDENAHIELLEPTSKDSAIYKFMEKNGPGIHHLCFRVKDVVSKHEELVQHGFIMIYPKAVKGAGNCLVNFIHPKSTGGVLIEISQKLS